MADDDKRSGDRREKMPTLSANHFAGAFNPTEIMITLGQSRIEMVDFNGVPTPHSAPDWFSTLTISPPAAKQLHMIFSAMIDEYEKRFGKIPLDPNSKINRNENAK